MNTLKKYAGNALSLISLILSIITICLYSATIAKTTSALGEELFYILISISMALLLLSNFLPAYKEAVLSIASGLYIASIAVFLNSQLSNIGYYAHGVYDIGDGILPSFVAGMVIGAIGLLIDIVLVFLKPHSLIGLIKHK